MVSNNRDVGTSYTVIITGLGLPVTSLKCCFELYKNVSEKQAYPLRIGRILPFFATLISAFNASLSFDSAEFLSRRLDGFERTQTGSRNKPVIITIYEVPTFSLLLTADHLLKVRFEYMYT